MLRWLKKQNGATVLQFRNTSSPTDIGWVNVPTENEPTAHPGVNFVDKLSAARQANPDGSISVAEDKCDHHFVFKAIDSDKPHVFQCNERDGAVIVAENVMRLCTKCLHVTRLKEGDLRERF